MCRREGLAKGEGREDEEALKGDMGYKDEKVAMTDGTGSVGGAGECDGGKARRRGASGRIMSARSEAHCVVHKKCCTGLWLLFAHPSLRSLR